jgi:glutamate 5-kinase
VLVAVQDTVAVQELRFGDNDTLSAQVATLVEADYLFLMTDVDALYTANPKVGSLLFLGFRVTCTTTSFVSCLLNR